MKSPANLTKAVSLLAVLVRRPVEFSDRLAGIADNLIAATRPADSQYQPEAWANVVAELEHLEPGVAAYLEEPGLQALERRVARRYEEVADSAWSGR